MVVAVELQGLAAALRVDRGELISLVGGGGKTTTLFTLGEQLGGTTVVTTTTKMGAEQQAGYTALVDPTDGQLMAELDRAGRALVWKEADGRRAVGVSPETCDRWFELADNVVVEADGSRKRPFKAPAGHEPVVPSQTTLLVACIGASALGNPIDECCHRPDLVAAIARCAPSDRLTPVRAHAVLTSDEGSRKGKPADARYVVAVHRVDAASADQVAELVDLLDDVEVIAVNDRNR